MGASESDIQYQGLSLCLRQPTGLLLSVIMKWYMWHGGIKWEYQTFFIRIIFHRVHPPLLIFFFCLFRDRNTQLFLSLSGRAHSTRKCHCFLLGESQHTTGMKYSVCGHYQKRKKNKGLSENSVDK